MRYIFAFALLMSLSGVKAAEVDLSTYEEIASLIKNKTYVGAKDESALKLLPQVVEPTRKIHVTVEDVESEDE